MTTINYRWRKVTDINREYALFELLEGDTPIFDLGFSDEGDLEIAFNSNIDSKLFELEEFLALINKGKELAECDR